EWSVPDQEWSILDQEWSILDQEWSILDQQWSILDQQWSVSEREWSVFEREWSVFERANRGAERRRWFWSSLQEDSRICEKGYRHEAIVGGEPGKGDFIYADAFGN
ncbi:MAG: hypothetical protein LBE17_11905, partial [Treponema sp.]|nr:hypothetical protein [Treponema sp.]